MAAYVGNPGYVGLCITVGTTPVNLLAAAVLIDIALSTVVQNCSALSIQADLVNGSNQIYVGDVNISTTRYGYALLAHDQVPYHSPINTNVPVNQIWLLGAAASLQVNIEMWFV